MRVAVITASDSGAAGTREDKSGPLIREIVTNLGAEVVSYALLPDERQQLADAMRELADSEQADLILTTGGTGFSLRDCTPEATLDVVERQTPGISEAMRAYSMQFTGRAMLSRAMAGIRKQTLIVNLPGSPKAVGETLEYIYPHLVHGIEILQGTAKDCARKDEKGKQLEGKKPETKTSGRKQPLVVAVCGVKNSGKTTCMESLIRLLSKEGYRVATIKHDGHDFLPDVPGTDSFRMRQAGAVGTAVFSSEQVLVYQKQQTELETLMKEFSESDLILVEGCKESTLQKFEIIRAGVSSEPVSNPQGRIGILTDIAGYKAQGEEIFDLNALEPLAEKIKEKMKGDA